MHEPSPAPPERGVAQRPVAGDEPSPPIFAPAELPAAACALALLVSMFALAWFGVDGIPGRTPAKVMTVDAWNGLSIVRWPMLITVLLALVAVPVHWGQRRHGAKTDLARPLLLMSTLTAALLTYRVLIALPDAHAIVDQKLGALVGLACALGLAVCALATLRTRGPESGPELTPAAQSSAPERPRRGLRRSDAAA